MSRTVVTLTCCARRSRRQRQTPAATVNAYTARARPSHATDAERALAHSRPTSILEKRNARSATLTTSFKATSQYWRADEPDSSLDMQWLEKGAGQCTTISCEDEPIVRI